MNFTYFYKPGILFCHKICAMFAFSSVTGQNSNLESMIRHKSMSYMWKLADFDNNKKFFVVAKS